MTSYPLIAPPPVRMAPPPRPPLARDRECLISGSCTGIARHLDAPVWAVRSLFIVLALMGGAGVLLYAWVWAFTQWQAGEAAPSRKAPVSTILLALAAVLLLLAVPGGLGVLLLASFFAMTLATASGLWAVLIDRTDPARGPRHTVIMQIAAVVVLILCALVFIPGRTALILLPMIGIALVLSSTLMHRWRELTGERIKRIREEQRSEMAAHLHDSVLQTLALIQNRSEASSEVSRIARAQERELRAWLYDGDAPADSDLPTDLRDYAGALEIDYPVRIDVVSAGLSAERASGEVAAAAREAILNAARHAGGEVSVYIEGASTGVDVFIRDRGAGFVVDEIPGDRLGVRESIIGRMRRVGGSATVRSDESGTEVHLHIGAGENHV